MKCFPFALLLALAVSCVQEKHPNKFSDPTLSKIADFQDRRLTDSLIQFLYFKEVPYRQAAALAMASVQDVKAADVLGSVLLEDTSVVVRASAAFALGQTKGFAAVNALLPALEDRSPLVVREVLEALGKAAEKQDIEAILKFVPNDSLTNEGQAWALYRLGLRGLADSLVVNRALKFLSPSQNLQTRLAAAHFFNRATFSATGFESGLIQAALRDTSPDVRMAATLGLKKLKNQTALDVLETIIRSENDYRVRVNAVRVLQALDWKTAGKVLELALKDKNSNVGIAASEVMKNLPASAPENVDDWARAATNERIQSNLYQVAMANNPTKELVGEIKQKYTAAKNDYVKAGFLMALSKSIEEYPFIYGQMMSSEAYVIKTTAAQALVEINRDKKFLSGRKTEFAEIYLRAIAGGDPGVIGIIASGLADPALGYREVIRDTTALLDAKSKLNLPKDIEALQPLNDAIAYLQRKEKPAPPVNSYNHPIDWNFVKTIKDNQQVRISTSRGDIDVVLLVEEAPGSVANFMELTKRNYFDGRFFHRVVPNFVAQTGCNRGDGFGSEDYSVRSEFSGRRYATGSVGMASAGKDTEGTQWFITHSPTPHLDGAYTIFGEVINGMDIVHQMEVGDKILDVTPLDN